MAGRLGVIKSRDKKQVRVKLGKHATNLKKRAKIRIFGNTKKARIARKRASMG